MTASPLLQIKDLHVQFDVFGGRLKVLDGVNFTVHAGEKVGLVGETGAGKTTMMKAILRILPQPPARIPEGQILFESSDILKASRRELMDALTTPLMLRIWRWVTVLLLAGGIVGIALAPAQPVAGLTLLALAGCVMLIFVYGRMHGPGR